MMTYLFLFLSYCWQLTEHQACAAAPGAACKGEAGAARIGGDVEEEGQPAGDRFHLKTSRHTQIIKSSFKFFTSRIIRGTSFTASTETVELLNTRQAKQVLRLL